MILSSIWLQSLALLYMLFVTACVLPVILKPKLNAPFIPSMGMQRKAALSLLQGLGPITVCELGSGWGGMGRLITRQAKNVVGYTGVELAWPLVLWSRLMSLFVRGRTRSTYLQGDICTTPLSYDVLLLYVGRELNEVVAKRVLATTNPLPRWAISITFPLPGFKVVREQETRLGRVWLYNLSERE